MKSVAKVFFGLLLLAGIMFSAVGVVILWAILYFFVLDEVKRLIQEYKNKKASETRSRSTNNDDY